MNEFKKKIVQIAAIILLVSIVTLLVYVIGEYLGLWEWAKALPLNLPSFSNLTSL